jgi:hypothetical protein
MIYPIIEKKDKFVCVSRSHKEISKIRIREIYRTDILKSERNITEMSNNEEKEFFKGNEETVIEIIFKYENN